jgi:hypothetical protein
MKNILVTGGPVGANIDPVKIVSGGATSIKASGKAQVL